MSRTRALSSQLSQALTTTVQRGVNKFNDVFETYTGISDLRQAHQNELKAEIQFSEISKLRKSCQDEADILQKDAREIKQKLDNTPRTSDNYLELLTREHELVKKQATLDIQLGQIKQEEQDAFDKFSRIVRLNQEEEWIRQIKTRQRAYLLAFLGFATNLVTYLLPKYNRTSRELATLNSEMENLAEELKQQTSEIKNQMNGQLFDIRKAVERIETQTLSKPEKAGHKRGWFEVIPGLYYIKRWLQY